MEGLIDSAVILASSQTSVHTAVASPAGAVLLNPVLRVQLRHAQKVSAFVIWGLNKYTTIYSIYITFSLSLFHSLSPSIYLSFFLCPSLCLSFSLCPSLYLSTFSLCPSLPLYLALSVPCSPVPHYLCLSLYVSLILSLSLSAVTSASFHPQPQGSDAYPHKRHTKHTKHLFSAARE